MKDFQISKFYTYFELTDSAEHPELVEQNRAEGIAFIPQIQETAQRIFDPLCEIYGKFTITSFFRGATLNDKIGGHPKSRHTMGLAGDIWRKNLSEFQVTRIATLLLKLDIGFHKFIFEKHNHKTWIHISTGTNLKRFLLYSGGVYSEKQIKIY